MTPNTPTTENMTELRVGDEQIELLVGQDGGPKRRISLPLGPARLVRDCLRHAPPRASDIEHAIDVIEDALAGVHGQPRGATLVTRDAVLHSLIRRLAPHPLPSPPLANLEEAELAFQRMASVSLGYPAGDRALGGTPHEAALLVLVRELMHHLGFVTITAIEDE
jgi:hypothetical protein